jgi:acyl carrier protein
LEEAMTVDEVRTKVYDIIVSKMGVAKEQIKDESKFTDDLGADSLDTVELVMEFENQFQIQIPDEDAEKISTVMSAISYIVEKKK